MFGPKFIPGHWSHVLPRWLGISGPMSFPGGLGISGPMSFPGGWISHHMSFPGGRVSLGVVSREYGTPYTTHPSCPEKATATVGMHPTGMLSCFNYHPQTKFAKVMFLQVSVCPQGVRHRPLPDTPPPRLVHAGIHPPPWILRDTVNKWVAFIPFLLFEFVIANHCNMAKCIGFYIQL